MRNRLKIIQATCNWIGVDPSLILKTNLSKEEKRAYIIIVGLLCSKDAENMSLGQVADYFSHSFHEVSVALGEHHVAYKASKSYRSLHNDIVCFYKSKKKAA